MSSRVVNVPQQRGFDSPEEEMVTVVGHCQRADRRYLIDVTERPQCTLKRPKRSNR